jgi:hypothetical protein
VRVSGRGSAGRPLQRCVWLPSGTGMVTAVEPIDANAEELAGPLLDVSVSSMTARPT